MSTEQGNVIEKYWRGAFGGFKEEWGLDFEERDNNPTKKWSGRACGGRVPGRFLFMLTSSFLLGVDTSIGVVK